MLAILLAAAINLQDNQPQIPAEKDWPLFQGHRPVAPSTGWPVRYWLYSFPAAYHDVTSKAKDDLTRHGYHEAKSREENAGHFVLQKGPKIDFTITVRDDSYSITRDKRISPEYPKKDPWERMETAKGWVLVVRAETPGSGPAMDFVAGQKSRR